MPPRPSRQPPRRKAAPERCLYTEGGQRCRRNGTGSPSLCRAHRLAAEEAARQPRSAVHDVADAFINGDRVSSSRIMDAVFEVFGSMFQGRFTPPYPPHYQGIPYPPRGADPGRREPPPPPQSAKLDPNGSDPKVLAARRSMEFDNEYIHLTPEEVKGRRRELARRYHPDLARDDRDRAFRSQRMADINAAADLLLSGFG